MATEVNKKHSPQKTLPKWAKLSKEQEYTIAQKNKKPSLVRLDTLSAQIEIPNKKTIQESFQHRQ